VSYQAVSWALSLDIPSSQKFVLTVMAHHVAEGAWEAFLSSSSIAKATNQDRKTVLASLERLRDAGLIVDTGRRVGETKQIPVYSLNSAEIGTVMDSSGDQESSAGDPELGTVKQSQNRNSSESGTVPNFPPNSTNFPIKQSQISRQTVPNLGHRKRKEKEGKKKEEEITTFALPDWVPPDAWRAFVEMRVKIKKPMTDYAKQLAVSDLGRLRDEGQDVRAVIDQSVLKSWQGFFAVKAANGTVNRHGDFEKQDYRAGVAADGRF